MSRQGRNRSQRSGLVGAKLACLQEGVRASDQAPWRPEPCLARFCAEMRNRPQSARSSHCGQADEVSQVWPAFRGQRKDAAPHPRSRALPTPIWPRPATSAADHPATPSCRSRWPTGPPRRVRAANGYGRRDRAFGDRRTKADGQRRQGPVHEEPVRKKNPKGAEARAGPPLPDLRRRRRGGNVDLPLVRRGPGNRHAGRPGGRVAPPPPPRSTGPPIHIAVTGLLSGTASVILLVLALIQSVRGGPASCSTAGSAWHWSRPSAFTARSSSTSASRPSTSCWRSPLAFSWTSCR